MEAKSYLDPQVLGRVCELLFERYKDRGRGAAERLRTWLSGTIPYAYPQMLEKHLDERYVPLLFDAFWQVLPFGTGGRRGRVGYGPNRLNPTTVAMTVQGHCEYLRTVFPERSDLAVVVANDVRVFHDIAGVYTFLGNDHPLIGVSARSLGKLACEIYAGNGIIAYCAEPHSDQAVLSTPELSYLIPKLQAVGGINLSASHNPPDDNGVKVYDQYGSQPIAPADQQLADAMAGATAIETLAFDQGLEQGFIRAIPEELHQEYIQTYVKLYDSVYTPQADIPVVYTPLSGCGLKTVGEVLEQLQFPVMTPADQEPDGTFAHIPLKAPNPEVPQATAPAKVFADGQGAGIVLSSDPDADRIGLEVKLSDGSWYHFNGNQIAAILCYFLMLDPEGPQRRGLVLETLVTTKILAKIVDKAGESWLVDDLLVGFKYVADVLKRLETEGQYKQIRCSPEQLVLAAEESHGVLLVPTIRDKDATPACMYLAALYQRLTQQGHNLLDYYIHILEELGGYAEVNRSIMMIGAEGVLRKDRIMESLRQTPPKILGGVPVRKVVDYWNRDTFGPFASETDKLSRDVVQLFTDHFIITVRPSGTEPKLKFYCQLLPAEDSSPTRGRALLQEVEGKVRAAAREVYNDLLAYVDLSLDEAALLLPDIIDINQKKSFEQRTVQQLHTAFAHSSFSSLDDLLSWLRGEVEAMTPGADPLPALKTALAYLCDQWAKEFTSNALLEELRNWTAH